MRRSFAATEAKYATVIETLSAIDWRRQRLQLGVASNQDQVGYGLVTMAMAERLLRDAVRDATGDAVQAPLIRFCPQHAIPVIRRREQRQGLVAKRLQRPACFAAG